jgi:hypothetical protein
MPQRRSLPVERRHLRRAAERRLHLRRHLQQGVLSERLGDDLRGGRQAVVTEPERNRDRRLAGHVEQRRERREAAGALQVGQRVLAAAVDRADRQRPFAERGREQEVELGEERHDPARHRLQLGDGSQIGDRRHLARVLEHRARQRLDLVILRRAVGEQLAVADAEAHLRPEHAQEQAERVAARVCGRGDLDLVAERGQHLARGVHAAHALRIDVDVERVGGRHRHAQPAGVAPHRRRVRLDRPRRPGGIPDLVAGEHVEQRSGFYDRAREHALAAEIRVAQVGPARDASAARLEPDQPATGRRDPQRAAAVVAVRDRQHARRHRGGRAA